MSDNFLSVAKQAALEAGKIISSYSGKVHQKNVKFEDSSDFATEADLEAEKRIVSIITKAFPEHNIIAEENERLAKGSEYTWVIDPLDGTFSFEKGIPYFAVSIGLVKNNEPILGVINHISADDLYFAQKGRGAYLNNKLIHVSTTENISEAAVVLGFGHKARRNAKLDLLDLYVNQLLTKVGHPYNFGSSAVTLAYVATGQLEAQVNDAWVWDFAAGAIIIEEAGGKITDLEGKEIDWTKERLNIIASNGIIHDQILEALKA